MVHQQGQERRRRRGELRGGELVDGLLGGNLPLAVLTMLDTTELTGVIREYGVVLAARQIVWPDTSGRMPWEGWDIPNEVQPLKG